MIEKQSQRCINIRPKLYKKPNNLEQEFFFNWILLKQTFLKWFQISFFFFKSNKKIFFSKYEA